MIDGYEDRPAWDDLSPGDEGPELVVENLSREDIVRYAGASGDFSRIHYDEPYVRDAGYEAVFAHGMLVAGHASHLVSGWLGLERIESFETRFTARAKPGRTITVSAGVTDAYREGGDRYVDVDFAATDDHGSTVLEGTAVANFER